MKTTFSRVAQYVPSFNGNKELPEAEQIKAKLTTLNLGDFFDVIDALGSVANEKGEVDVDAVQKRGLKGMRPLLELGARILPQYAEVSGLLDGEGNPVTPALIGSNPFFLGLNAELLGKLAEISAPSQAEVKN